MKKTLIQIAIVFAIVTAFSFYATSPAKTAGATITSIRVNGTSATITWSPVTGAIDYHLQVDADPKFGNPIADIDHISGTTQTVSGLSSQTTYYAHVKDNQSFPTSYGPVESFTTQ